MQRREPPILPLGEEQVGRGSTGHAEGERRWEPPRVEALSVDTERQVEEQARLSRRLGELPLHELLHVGVKQLRRGLPLEVGTEAGVRVEILGSAPLPRPIAVAGGRGPRETLQRAALQGVHEAVVDVAFAASPRDEPPVLRRSDQLTRLATSSELRRALHVDVQLVPEQPADRGVRAGVERLLEERRQQGERPDHVAAESSNPLDQVPEVGEIADSPIPRRPDRVEGQEHAPAAPAGTLVAAGRRRDHEGLLAGVRYQTVIAGRERIGR
jgi:hypothetical protein